MSLTKATYSMIEGAPVNVLDFGAVGDGVADDTVAIQAAIDYCTNLSTRKQTLYFPASAPAQYYKVTAPLVISGRLNIIGDGEFTTLIYGVGLTAGQFILDFDNEVADNVYFGGISQITIRSNNNTPNAIRLRNTSYWTLKNVQLYGFQTGIYITGGQCFSNFFEQVTCYQISAYSVHMADFTGGGQYQFLGCTFTGNDGVFIASTAATDSFALYNCNFEQCAVTDLYINGTVQGLTVSGCRSEGLNGAASFLIDPAATKFVRGISITSCFWASDSGNAYPVQIGGSGGNVQGFNISGNYAGYIGLLAFVNLNGFGEGGVISGNYCLETPTAKIVTTPRQGVVAFSNYNQTGLMTDYENLVVLGRAAAAPVSGTYAVGSLVYNSAPTAGGFVGWVCTTAGTPGTWKTFGAISV